MRVRSLLAASAIGFSLLLAPVQAASAAAPVHTAGAVVHKSCTASVSVLHPKNGTTTVVKVGKVGARVRVTATAQYKSKKTQNFATSSSSGLASIPFKISTATKGYKVVVSVTASSGNTTWACSTYFIPA